MNIMGVDSKLFVTCKPEKSNEVYANVKKALDKWQRSLLKGEYLKKGFNNPMTFLYSEDKKELKNWSNGIFNCSTYDFISFNMGFRVAGENRSLFCTHYCSGDYSETYKGDKIIFSIGCWGMSDQIMKVVGEACKEFGDVYYDFNDCDDKDFIKLN